VIQRIEARKDKNVMSFLNLEARESRVKKITQVALFGVRRVITEATGVVDRHDRSLADAGQRLQFRHDWRGFNTMGRALPRIVAIKPKKGWFGEIR
jgi:hypothetical protein